MARRTAALKSQLNQIRTWARDGRTDAWIAFQLGTTAATVQEFRSEHGLDKGGGNPAEEPVTPEHVVQTISFDTPPPVAAATPAAEESSAAEPAPRTRRQRRSRTSPSIDEPARVEAAAEAPAESGSATGDGEPAERAKRRRRRGGRGGGAAAEPVAASAQGTPAETEAAGTPARAPAKRRPRTPPSYQGSVVEGALIVLDPAVARSAAWRAHWADGPAFDVVIEDDQIILRRRGNA